jgi:hypothetical protein
MHHHHNGVTFGLIVLAVGIVFLLRNLGIIEWVSWGIMWPVILIVVGIGVCIQAITSKGTKKKK